MLMGRWLILVVFGVTGCSRSCDRPELVAPNVVLIVMDTVRADHLGSYGYHRPTTPNLDRFARRATRYSRAISNAAWTLPSHASLFTGKLPFEHKAHFRHIKKGGNESAFDGSVPTLAETFKEMGYSTAGIVANDGYLDRRWGLWRGFDTYSVDRKHVDPHTDKAVEWLENHKTEPFFLFINYMDVHGPYNRAPRPDVVGYAVPTDLCPEARLRPIVLPGEKPAPPDLVKDLVDIYDTALANLDTGLHRLLAWFEEEGLLDKTLIVITSDHGHFLVEHRLVGHPRDVYQGTIHVPLIVRTPNQAEGGVDDTVVALHQVPHLILSQVNTEQAKQFLPRFPAKPGSKPAMAEQYWERGHDMLANPRWGHRFDRIRRAWFNGSNKLIHSSDGAHELYDLDNDPKEETNLFSTNARLANHLIARVESTVSQQPGPTDTAPVELSEEEIERLKALGYITE